MKTDDFNLLIESIREGSKILNNVVEPSRKYEITNNEIKELRLKFNLTQDKFAQFLGISVGTLKNWEQGRRKPTGPANRLLSIVGQHPDLLTQSLLFR